MTSLYCHTFSDVVWGNSCDSDVDIVDDDERFGGKISIASSVFITSLELLF